MSQQAPPPRYRDATYGDESVVLENKFLRLVMHKRMNGWGYGELYGPDESGEMNDFLAVMEHLAEIDVVGMEYPLRLDADEYTLNEIPGGQELVFDVAMQTPQTFWLAWGSVPAVKGRVVLSLKEDEPWIGYSLFVKPEFSVRFRSLRGPWLHVGAESFGLERTDAILPGLEWLIGDEWSSGTENLAPPFAMRMTPDPRKVSAPIMAISHNGTAVGLSWGPEQPRANIDDVQPVFASPNFIDRKSEHLLGLMYPSVTWGLGENELTAQPPISMPGDGLYLSAEIGVCKGGSIDMLLAWLDRHGMPEPGEPRFEWHEAIERIAKAYNSNLWTDGEGFLRSWHLAPVQPFLDVRWEEKVDFAKRVPRVIEYFIENNKDTPLAKELAGKIEWCRKEAALTIRDKAKIGARFDLLEWYNDEELRALGESILKEQTETGDFPFDPYGRHKAFFITAALVWKPLGQPGDSCLNLCMTSALLLLLIGDCLDEPKFLDAGRKTLDFAMPMVRPEGGDWWETPLHAPNLMTAGYTAITYFVGHELLGDDAYLSRARQSLRGLLPFTALSETKALRMLYQPKPLFGSTGWHLVDWTTRHILCQILMLFDISDELGIDWAKIDPAVDWATYQRGITVAGIRWLADHTDEAWMVMVEREKRDTNKKVMQDVRDGKYDMIVPDNFDPATNAYGGMQINIPPDTLGGNILCLIRRLASEADGS